MLVRFALLMLSVVGVDGDGVGGVGAAVGVGVADCVVVIIVGCIGMFSVAIYDPDVMSLLLCVL